MTTQNPSQPGDLFFEPIVEGYLSNLRFVRRDWLAEGIAHCLNMGSSRFVLLTAEPGFGKSAFMAQLAAAHPDWPRYFIRRDQRTPLGDVDAKSFLLRIGYQLATLHPDLFTQERIQLSVEQRIGDVAAQGEVVGAEVKRILASPFYQKAVAIRQYAERNAGRIVGLKLDELVIETRQLDPSDLLYMAFLDPARALLERDPAAQIVVLVDALDEIRYHEVKDNILEWLTNCPELPPNLHFVLSSRPPNDALKVFCEKQALSLRRLALTPNDPQVESDVQIYARRLATRPVVATELVQLNIDVESFVAQAAEKANGNIGYLDAVERAIDAAFSRPNGVDRASLDALLKLSQLPNELGALYGFFLHQIKASVARERIEFTDPQTGETYDKAVWPAVYHRVLGVLAVALAPLRLDHIIALGGVKEGREYTIEAMNSLVQFLDTEQSGYRLYHATVPEFLTASSTKEQAETTDLWIDVSDWNKQIANHYWNTYHDDWSCCDDYGLNSLTTHLYRSNQFERLAALINQAWMRARFNGGGYIYDGFITDIMLAWQHAYEEALGQITTEKEPAAMADCIRFALIRTSINSLSLTYPPLVVMQAVQLGLWSPERAMSIAYRSPEPQARFGLFNALLKTSVLSPKQRGEAERLALSTAIAINDDRNRADALTELAPQLSEGSEKALAEAMSIALKFLAPPQDPEFRVRLLKKLAPLLTEAQITDVLTDTGVMTEGYHCREVISAFAPYLSETQLAKAFTIVTSMETWRAEALTALAPWLTGTLLDDCRIEAKALKDPMEYASVLVALAPNLSLQDRDPVLTEVWATAKSTKFNNNARVRLLIKLATQVQWEEHELVVAEALAAAQLLTNEFDRTQAICELAPFLEGVLLNEALTAAYAMTGIGSHNTLVALVPKLNETQVADLLNTIDAHIDEWWQIEILLDLASKLSGEAQHRALTCVLSSAKRESYEESRAKALAKLAPWLTGSLVEDAITVAKSIRSERYRALALAAIAPQLPPERQQSIVSDALATHGDIKDTGYCAQVLALFVSHLTGETRDQAISTVLAAAKGDPLFSDVTLPNVAGGYPEQLRIKTEYVMAPQRATALVALAPQLDKLQLTEAFDIASAIEDERYRAIAMAAIGSYLPANRRVQTLKEVLAGAEYAPWYGSEPSLADILIVCAPQLKGLLLLKAVGAANGYSDNVKCECLAALAPRIIGPLRRLILGYALELAKSVDSEPDRLRTLVALAPHLSGSLLSEALIMARSIQNPSIRALTLSAFASNDRMVSFDSSEVLTSVMLTGDTVTLAKVLFKMGPHLTGDQRERAQQIAMMIDNQGLRSEALVGFLQTEPNSKDLLCRIRCAVVDHLYRNLSASTRMSLLQYGSHQQLLAPPIIGADTLNHIARSIIEICSEWKWS